MPREAIRPATLDEKKFVVANINKVDSEDEEYHDMVDQVESLLLEHKSATVVFTGPMAHLEAFKAGVMMGRLLPSKPTVVQQDDGSTSKLIIRTRIR